MSTPGFFYLATPYRSYLPLNHDLEPGERYELAYLAALRVQARCLDAGIEVFCPIVHCHHTAVHVTSADPSSDFWVQRQVPFLRASVGLLIAKMPGWDVSSGIRFERDLIRGLGKPVHYLEEPFEDLLRSLQCP